MHIQYYSRTVPFVPRREKVTHVHFYFHDILSGPNLGAIQVAGPNTSNGNSSVSPFASVFAANNPLTVGPDPTSELISNVQGMYVSSGELAVIYIDFMFTKGTSSVGARSAFSQGIRLLRRIVS